MKQAVTRLTMPFTWAASKMLSAYAGAVRGLVMAALGVFLYEL